MHSEALYEDFAAHLRRCAAFFIPFILSLKNIMQPQNRRRMVGRFMCVVSTDMIERMGLFKAHRMYARVLCAVRQKFRDLYSIYWVITIVINDTVYWMDDCCKARRIVFVYQMCER